MKPTTASRPPVSIESSQEDIVDRKEVLRRLNRGKTKKVISNKKFGELLGRGLIPQIDLGHRTKRYRESAVRAALIALEKEVEA